VVVDAADNDRLFDTAAHRHITPSVITPPFRWFFVCHGWYSSGMEHKEKTVRVGIGVFIFKDGTFLMQQRHGAHGAGSWSVPGGHQEFGESFEQTARREVLEETGMEIKNVRFGAVTNDYFPEEDKHYVTIWVLSDWASGEPQICEPEKCLRQAWRTFDTLPTPYFIPLEHLLQSQFIDAIKQQV
jgi:8-oxo-dGTP diphosphatase